MNALPNDRYYAIQLPPVLLPMLRQWMRTHCGQDYQEPHAFQVGTDGDIRWEDDETTAFESISSHPEFTNVSLQRSLKPYRSLSQAELDTARNLLSNPSRNATDDEIRTLTTPVRFPDAKAFRDARTGTPGSEKDFGATHREHDTAAPDEQVDSWTVAVVNETGDVYAECRRTGEIILLGRVSANDGYADADHRFQGWEQSTKGRTLDWFTKRCSPGE